jgi:hypothetical protein
MAMTENALVPLAEKQVEFYGDELMAVLVNIDSQPEIYVPVKPISDALGLDWSAQYRRIQRDQVLADASHLIAITAIKPERGRPDAICLPLKFIPGWLFGIQANRVKEDLRDKVLRYQRECYDVLWEAFQEGRLTADPTFTELLESGSPAAQAYKLARAMMEMARNQLLLEARIETHDVRLADYERRLEGVEAVLGDPGRFITQEQATSISQAVKSIAMVLGKKSGRNEYGAVYGEFYRKFGIPSYRELPARRFDEAIRFLTEWYQELTGEGLPF